MYSKTTKRIIVVFVLFLLLSITPSTPSQIRYNVIDLGTLDGYQIAQPYSINNKGQIVGRVMNINAQIDYRAVLFDSNGLGLNKDLGTLGGQDSAALSINNTGQIVGVAADAADRYHATIFDADNPQNNIKLVPDMAVYSNNDLNEIVGWICYDATPYFERAALISPNQPDSFIDLGTLPGYITSQAAAINNIGTIVGLVRYNSQDVEYLYDTRAVLFNREDPNRNRDLGSIDGYDYAAALSINDNGQIVGRANNHMSLPFDYAPRAVLFNTNEPDKNLDLGTLPGYDAAEAFSINNRGQIVGRANQSSSGYAATLFDPSGQGNNINLEDLIDPVLGWDLDAALCINDYGWIVGWGGHPDSSGAFLLIPIPAGPADFDQNGKVDFYDFAIFAAAWDAAFGDESYNPACDLEPDGQINYYDLEFFVDGWSPDL